MATTTRARPKQAEQPTYAAPALEKGIDVLEHLGNQPGGLTISEIAQSLGRSISELFRVVVVLERRGWLRKDPGSDRYRVSYRLLEVAHRATPAQELTHVATAPMHLLAAQTMQSCHLAVLNGARGLIVARQESPGPTGFAVRLGHEIDLSVSCSGHVLLAFLEEERRELIMPAGLPKALMERLRLVRERGYESVPSSRMAAISDMSCPIFGFDGHIVAALTIPYLRAIDDRPHKSAEETLELLRTAAGEISMALGWFDREQAPMVPSLSVPAPPARRRGAKVA